MRFISFAVLVLLLASASAKSRRKRFLNTDALSFLPHSLTRLSDYARDLSDQISSQASLAVQQMMPQSSRAAGLRRELEQMPKRSDGVPPGRETEGDDIEIFNPVEPSVTKGNPEDSAVDWFRPLVPFSFSFGLLTPWWKGPNVCVEKDEVDEPEQDTEQFFDGFSINFETTRCVPSDSSYSCTKKIQSNGVRKTIITRHQCCHGYIRRTDGRPGCSLLKMENVLETLKVLDMNRFAEWVESSGYKGRLSSENYTLFAPSNDAITDYEDEIEDNEISAIEPAKLVKDVSSVVLGHIVEGFVNVDNLEDEQLIDTLNSDVKIRINKYHSLNQVVTANCIPVTGKNNFATNGIVHLVSGILPSPTQSLAEMIEKDEQFSVLNKLLKKNGLMEELAKPGQSWTLFAPTDEAFEKLPRSLRNEIESGEACVENILQQHLVKGTVCTSAVIHQIRIKNVLNNALQVTRDEAEKLRVDGAPISAENNLGSNGVLHAVDKVLIPPQAQSLMKSLEMKREDIFKLIEKANLVSMLEDMKNITFFIPSVQALENLPKETREQMENDPDVAKNILLSHLVASHMPSSTFSDKYLETLSGRKLQMKLQDMFGLVTIPVVQCAVITSHQQVCGAVMHEVNKVIMPPKGNIVEVLKGMKDHKTVLKMLQTTQLDKMLEEEGAYTFLAPSDEAFDRFSNNYRKEIVENVTKAEEILKMHILPETLCCNGISRISPFHRQYLRTLSGDLLPAHNMYNSVKFGRARATHCDISASNGLLHSINRVIFPQKTSIMTFFGI